MSKNHLLGHLLAWMHAQNLVMRILHTADWHLGQNFFGYDRSREHEVFLNWLLDRVEEYRPDALLVAGDVFDGPNPPASSQRRYYSFLSRLTEMDSHVQTVIIAGNHDSAARLEAAVPLLEDRRVFVRGFLPSLGEGRYEFSKLLLPLYDRQGRRTWCMAVPFLRMGEMDMLAGLRQQAGENGTGGVTGALATDVPEPGVCPEDSGNPNRYRMGVESVFDGLYQALSCCRQEGERAVILAHLQATGSEISEEDRSERIVIGGVESVLPEVFDKKIDYVALGHLHRAQKVSGREHVRYAGAPLPMSFAETRYRQGIYLVDMEEGKEVEIERIEFAPPVPLLRLPERPAALAEVLSCLSSLPEIREEREPESSRGASPDGQPDRRPYLEVRICESHPSVFMKEQIGQALEHKAVRLAKLVLENPHPESADREMLRLDMKSLGPMELAEKLYRKQHGEELPSDLQQLLLRVISEVEQENVGMV